MNTRTIPDRAVIKLIARIILLQKQYAHEQSGVRNERRAEAKKLVNSIAAEIESVSGGANGN
jgi:hypothetical protein